MDVGKLRLPSQLEQQGRIVKGTGRSIYDVPWDAAVLTIREGFLSELYELVLAHIALPAIAGNPWRIDTAGGTTRTAGTARDRTGGNREASAVRVVAIDRAWNPQERGYREVFGGPSPG